MTLDVTADATLSSLRGYDMLIDVRSPAEFEADHVPGAVNLPVLSNEERAEVGTIYVQKSRFMARRIGAAHVAAPATQGYSRASPVVREPFSPHPAVRRSPFPGFDPCELRAKSHGRRAIFPAGA